MIVDTYLPTDSPSVAGAAAAPADTSESNRLLVLAQAVVLSDPRQAHSLVDAVIEAEALYIRGKARFVLARFMEALKDLEVARSSTMPRELIQQIDILTADCYQQLERYEEAITCFLTVAECTHAGDRKGCKR
jgi:hypothetical protein